MKPFTILVGLAALAVAGCAAFFSVTGLALLFSGASLAVAVMGTSLEIAKLIAASYLHRFWKETNKLLRFYLLLGVLILVVITSAGIFGFLSNAYQSTSLKSDVVSREIGVFQSKITQNEQQIAQLNSQMGNLQQNSGTLLGSGKVNNRLIRSIDNRDRQITKLSTKIGVLNDSIAVWNIKINEIKNNNLDLEREIGGFKFIAEAFDLPINSVVKFFIFLLIFVFDPMAVTLLIAFNTALEQDRKKKPKKSEDIINSLENYLNNTPKEQLDIDFKEIDDLVEKNYEIYGDSEKIEKNVEENINTFSDTEETVSITPKAPYYTLPDFNWDNKSLWINDRHAIKYWMRTQKGNQRELDKLKEDEDFTSKSY
jgi:peptidoglycan hydrolase CwlO-like protein